MTGFRKISRNVDFWPKMAIFDQNGPKRPKRDFSAKIRKCHFRRIGKPQLCVKTQNNPMIGFLDLHRTYERTDGLSWYRLLWYSSSIISPFIWLQRSLFLCQYRYPQCYYYLHQLLKAIWEARGFSGGVRMLLEVVFVLYEKVATNGTFVTTVSYGTHMFYFFGWRGARSFITGTNISH